jgi:glycosyltransferase involved in cell wall biosynthesis
VQQLDRLEPRDLEIVVLAHPGQPLALRHLRVERVEVDTRVVARRLTWIHASLPAWCARHGVDVLHKLATEVPFALPRTRLVTTVHDFMAEFHAESHAESHAAPADGDRLRRAYFALATRRCFARSDRVIAVSESVAAEARARHPEARDRIVAVPQGVDHPKAPCAARAAAERGARVLYVGVFLPHKGQLHAVRALDALAGRAPALARRTSLTFRGAVVDARHHEAVRRAAAGSRVAERIGFQAYERDADVDALYADVEVLLLLSEYEGFGLPLLEAQVRGIPVVCSDLPVFREVLGDSACFVEARDAEAVAAALEGVLTDDGLRAELARRGCENARRFSWERTARGTLEVYRRVALG